MNLTEEQQQIVHYQGNMKVNAVAGSGKTTTLLEYAKAQPSQTKMLYLAFNKSVRLEAEKRFAQAGLPNVRVETAHSLAFRHTMRKHGYELNHGDYKTHEIAEILGLTKEVKEPNLAYILARHIQKYAAYFCNSDVRKVKNLNYLAIVTDPKNQNICRKFL